MFCHCYFFTVFGSIVVYCIGTQKVYIMLKTWTFYLSNYLDYKDNFEIYNQFRVGQLWSNK
jgi:hypothetical protein